MYKSRIVSLPCGSEPAPVYSVTLSKDCRLFVVCGGLGCMGVWKRVKESDATPTSSSSSSGIVESAMDAELGKKNIQFASTPGSIHQAHKDTVWGVTIHPRDSVFWSFSGDGMAKEWDVSTLKCRRNITDAFYSQMWFALEGRYLLVARSDFVIDVIDPISLENVHSCIGHDARIHDVALSNNEEWFATASQDGNVCLWRFPDEILEHVKRERIREKEVHQVEVEGEVDDDGQYQLARPPQTPISGVDISIPVCQLKAHDDAVRSVSFSPNEKFMATGSSDGSIMVWKFVIGGAETSLKDISQNATDGVDVGLRSMKCVLVKKLKGSELGVESVRFTFDGRFLLSAGADEVICVWGTEKWELLGTCAGHTDWVACLTPIPGGSEFFSSSMDGSVRRWTEEKEL